MERYDVRTVEDYWSQVTGRMIEIIERRWSDDNTDYALYVDGEYEVSFPYLTAVEEYLNIVASWEAP